MLVTIQQIEDQLASTQCEECGYKGCRPYAEAIFSNEADINLCRPGGERVIANLSKLLGKEPLAPAKQKEAPLIAWVDPARCIGCTLCIQACPTDAIVGRSKRMHSIITDECSGCRLCIPPCPVDCIEMNDASEAFPKAGDDKWEEGRSKQISEWIHIKKERKQQRRSS
jgi:electron transport complex protein RnfB